MRDRIILTAWIVFICAVAVLGQTWSKWNGITVGSTSGNVGKWNNGTIGTTAGNIGKWNNLASPGGGAGGITAGDAITCEFEFANAETFTSVTDTLNSATFTVVNITNFTAAALTERVGLYYFQNSAHGSSDTITLQFSSAHGGAAMSCQAWKNAKTSTGLDTGTANPGNTAAGGTTSTNPTSGNFQTTANGDLIIGVMVNGGVATPTAGNGTLIDTIANEAMYPEYYVQTTASSSTTLTYTAASDVWGEIWGSLPNNGSTLSLDGTCHALTDNGATSSNQVVVTISC